MTRSAVDFDTLPVEIARDPDEVVQGLGSRFENHSGAGVGGGFRAMFGLGV